MADASSSSKGRRSLRPRKEGQSFTQLFQPVDLDEEMLGDSEDDAETARKKLPQVEDPVTDSEYDPVEAAEKAGKGGDDAQDETDEAEDANATDDDEKSVDSLLDDGSVVDMSIRPAEVPAAKNPGRKRSKPTRAQPSSVPGGSKNTVATFNFKQKRPGNRTVISNPAAALSRARAKPLFIFPGLSRRLEKKPSPFEPPVLVETNGPSGAVSLRVSKAWCSGIFPGPTWQMLEDIGWYKELVHSGDGERSRQTVHKPVTMLPESFKILTQESVPSSSFTSIRLTIGASKESPILSAVRRFNTARRGVEASPRSKVQIWAI